MKNKVVTAEEFFENWYKQSGGSGVYDCLNDFAKLNSVAFAEWAADNLWTYHRTAKLWSRADIKLTTEQLYALFQKENQTSK